MDAWSRRRGRTALFLGWAALVAVGSAIPDEAGVGAGTRVRVTTTEGRQVGRLVTIRDDVLALERSGQKDPLEIRRPEVLALEISERPSRRGRGAAIGALVGLGGAVALGALGGDTCPSPPAHADWGTLGETLAANLCFSHTETAVLGGILTVPLGALIGAAVGHGEQWRRVGAAELSVQVGPSQGVGAGVRLAVRF